MKVAEVILRAKLRKDLEVFDYEIPKDCVDQVSLGSFVSVPFRNQEVLGVVTNIKDVVSSKYKLKKLCLFEGQSFCAHPYYGENIKQLAKKFVVSPNHLLTFGFPTIPRRIYDIDFFRNRKVSSSSLKFDQASRDSVTSLLGQMNFQKKDGYAVQYVDFKERVLLYLAIIKKSLHSEKQVLFVFPEVSDIYDFFSFLPEEWRSRVAIWHGGMSKNDSFSFWKKIVSGDAKIILGTQTASFLPFKKLGFAVIDNEQDLSHKQTEHNPRFSPSGVLEHRFEREDFSLILSSFALRSETLYKYQKKKTLLLSEYKQKETTDARLVDLRDAFLDKEFHYVNPTTERAIAEALENKSRIFLFFPRKGFSRRLYCKSCSSVEKCHKCLNPYTIYKDPKTSKDILRCSSCKNESDFIFACSSCKGSDLVRKGFGIERIQSRLKELFPEVPVLRMDSSTNSFDDGASPIVIGTEYAFRKLKYSTYYSIVFLSADEVPKRLWRSTEAWYFLLKEVLMMSRSFHVSKVVFQSFHPDSDLFRFLLSSRPLDFYEHEIKGRKSFGYPPFSELFRILCTAQTEKKATSLQRQVYQNISSQSSDKDQVLCSDQIDKRGKKFYTYILIKASQGTKFDFSFFPEGVFLDPNPEQFL